MSATPHDQPKRAIVPVSDEERAIVAYQQSEGFVVGRAVLKPSNPADPPGMFWRFINFLRASVGLRSLELWSWPIATPKRRSSIGNTILKSSC
jgi:hypothetical protein